MCPNNRPFLLDAARIRRVFYLMLVFMATGPVLYGQQHELSQVNFQQVTSVTAIEDARFLVTQAGSENHLYIYDAARDETETSITLEHLAPRPVAPASLQPMFSPGETETPEHIQGLNYGYYNPDEQHIIAFTANHQIMEVDMEGQTRRSLGHPPMNVHFVQRLGNQLWVSGSSFLGTRQLLSNQPVAVGFVLDLNSFSIVRNLRMPPEDFGIRLDSSLRRARGFYFQPYVIPVSQSSFVLTAAGAADFVLQNPGQRPQTFPGLRPEAVFEATMSQAHGVGVRTEAVNLHIAFHEGQWWISSGNRHQEVGPSWTIMEASARGQRSEISLDHQPLPVSADNGSASIVCTPGTDYTLCRDYFSSQANYILRIKN